MDWDIHLPINFLPKEIINLFREHADFLYSDLDTNHLKVVLIPASSPRYQGHMIRMIESKNPEWYSELYKSYPYLKRQRSLKALSRIKDLKDQALKNTTGAVPIWYTYDTLYRCLISERLVFGYRENGFHIPPEKRVQEIFETENIETKIGTHF